MASKESKPCVNNCGFYGSPAKLNLCSKCYEEHCLKESKLLPMLTIPRSPSVDLKKPKEISKRRCGECDKKLGLTKGFTCRCRVTFCAAHRCSEDHVCLFDFKAMGRALLAKSNPLIRADKLERI